MSKHEPNPYFALLHGSVVSLEDIKRKAPYTMAAVETYMQTEYVVGQMTLPLDGQPTDTLLWSPPRKKEKEAGLQEKLSKVRAELKTLNHRVLFQEESEPVALEANLPVDIR